MLKLYQTMSCLKDIASSSNHFLWQFWKSNCLNKVFSATALATATSSADLEKIMCSADTVRKTKTHLTLLVFIAAGITSALWLATHASKRYRLPYNHLYCIDKR